MRNAPLLAAAAAALAVVATGCGVGSSDEGAVSDTTSTYLSALADGDYALACEQLAQSARPSGDCATGVRASVAGIPRETFAEDADGKSKIDVDDDVATVTLSSGTTLRLARVGGAWLVSSPYTG
jgi:hypothetical protein